MGRTSRRSSEDHSSAKKRSTRSRDTPSPPRKSSSDRSSNFDSNFTPIKAYKKRDEKRDEKVNTHDLRNRKDRSESKH